MSRKLRTLICVYLTAALLTLGVLSAVIYGRLTDYRRSAAYSARQAFEETVRSADALSLSLEKGLYASDGDIRAQLCAQAYAQAMAAQAALSVLPFSTQELERSAEFINIAGDYAYTLCGPGAAEGFQPEQWEQLRQLSADAADYADMLRRLQGDVNNGLTIIDSREQPLQNVEPDGTPLLSASLLDYESRSPGGRELLYDGKYGRARESASGELSDEELLALAAAAAGVEPRELKREYDYQGTDGRRCYSAGDLLLCVSSWGLESMAQSRLIGEAGIGAEEAETRALDFLEKQGYKDLAVISRGQSGGAAVFRFAPQAEGAVCLDNYLSLSVALDDGSIYMFNAASYSPALPELKWAVTQAQAEETLGDRLELLSSRRVIIKSAGGRDLGCYELSCTGINGRGVRVYVDGETGRQRRIELA